MKEDQCIIGVLGQRPDPWGPNRLDLGAHHLERQGTVRERQVKQVRNFLFRVGTEETQKPLS